MPWLFLSLSLLLGAVTGFAVFSRGAFYSSLAGQVVQGVLSIACFALIVLAFWRHGWKIGVAEVLVIFGGANIGLSLFKHLVRK